MTDHAPSLTEIARQTLADDEVRYDGRFPVDYEAEFARTMFFAAYAESGNPSEALSRLDAVMGMSDDGSVGPLYTGVVGTDSANGWDKVRHFVASAALQDASGGFLAPELFAYGKEVFDALEKLVGKDPEGYSVEDIHSDNLGEAFAEELDRDLMKAAGALLGALRGCVAVEGSLVLCGTHGITRVIDASATVSAGGLACARKLDATACGGRISSASATVTVDGRPLVRVGDRIDHGGVILTGVPMVFSS